MQTMLTFPEFIEQVRALCAERLSPEIQWIQSRALLAGLISNEALRIQSSSWPVGAGKELLLHSDSDYGFFVGALVRRPHHKAGAHDHGRTWTVYGVLDGQELTRLFERVDDGLSPGRAQIKLVSEIPTPKGSVEIVKPWQIHAENNVGERSVAITLRSEQPGGYDQTIFHDDGLTSIHRGLQLIPFDIEEAR